MTERDHESFLKGETNEANEKQPLSYAEKRLGEIASKLAGKYPDIDALYNEAVKAQSGAELN